MKILKIAIFLLFACVIGGCSKTEETKISLESISIQTALSLQEGKTQQLTATTAPSGITEPYTLAWSSSNAEVATVDGNGTVKALKPGTSTVKVYEQSRPNISASCAVTVTATPVEIASVSFVNPPQTLEEEESKTLETKVAPENINQPYELVFTSSDPAVATVSPDGVLKALKAGQATIGVAVKDKPTLKADFQLEVIAKDFTIEIPDANFKKFLLENENTDVYPRHKYDLNEDGEIQASEMEKIRNLAVNRKSIKSLKGIEFCSNLESLWCQNNEITELNVKDCKKLKSVRCDTNKIVSLDVSGLTSLSTITCNNNPLEMLDASNTNIQSLYTPRYSNEPGVHLRNTQIKVLNLSGCKNLHRLRYENPVFDEGGYFVIENGTLTYLNITGCSSLIELEVDYGQLTTLGLSDCSSLQELSINWNKISSIDVSNCRQLENLNAYGNSLVDINITYNTKLKQLEIGNNKLSYVDVKNCLELEEFDACDNNISLFDISKNTALKYFSCTNNPTTTIFVWKGFSTEGRSFNIPGSAVYVEKE